MKKYILVLSLLCSIFLWDCCKPQEEVLEPVRIFLPSDTTDGIAKGLKNNQSWTAGVQGGYYDTTNNIMGIVFATVSARGFIREGISFQKLKYDKAKYYFVDVGDRYLTYGGDGGLQNAYIVDNNAADNRLNITLVDKVNSYVEGNFTMTFMFDPKYPGPSDIDPPRVKFKNVFFKVKLKL
jgi:hypothetical protein